MSNSKNLILRPKPVRVSASFHTSYSQVFTTQAANSVSTSPVCGGMQKAKSEELRPVQALSLEKLAGIQSEGKYWKMEEMAKVEMELKRFSSPRLTSAKLSDEIKGDSSSFLRRSCPAEITIPKRPSNPMVRDKLWANDGTSSSTEEDSEVDEIVTKEEEVVLEGNNTDHV